MKNPPRNAASPGNLPQRSVFLPQPRRTSLARIVAHGLAWYWNRWNVSKVEAKEFGWCGRIIFANHGEEQYPAQKSMKKFGEQTLSFRLPATRSRKIGSQARTIHSGSGDATGRPSNEPVAHTPHAAPA